MSLTINHTFVSAKADSADLTLINPSNWNAVHTVVGDFGYLLSTDFGFTPQSPGDVLVVGSNAITLDPYPRGLAIGNSLYITNGVGDAEVVPITGLTSTTVIVTCANEHSEGWTIQSATAGIQEALVSGPAVLIPAGTHTIRDTVKVTGGQTLIGYGANLDCNFPLGFDGSAVLVLGSVEAAALVTANTTFNRLNATGASLTVANTSSYTTDSLLLLNGTSELSATSLIQLGIIRSAIAGVITLTDRVYVPLTTANFNTVQQISPVFNVTLAGFILDATNSGTVTTLRGILFNCSQDCTVRDVRCVNFIFGAGIYFLYCYGNTVENCSTYACGSEAESDFFFIGSAHCKTNNCNSDTASGFGPQWQTCTFFSSTGWHISGIASGRGMKVQGCGHCQFSNFSITNCTDTGRGTIGVVLGSWNNKFSNFVVSHLSATIVGAFWLDGEALNNQFINITVNESTYAFLFQPTAKYNTVTNLSTNCPLYFEVGSNQNYVSITGLAVPSNIYDQGTNNLVEYLNPQWVEPALAASWVNYGAPDANCAYKILSTKCIALKGTIKDGVSPAALFNLFSPSTNGLPLPTGNRNWKMQSLDNSARLTILAGDTSIYVTSADVTKVSLDGIILQL